MYEFQGFIFINILDVMYFKLLFFIFINIFYCKYLYDTVRNITGTIKSLYNAIFGVRFFSYRKYRFYDNLTYYIKY